MKRFNTVPHGHEREFLLPKINKKKRNEKKLCDGLAF